MLTANEEPAEARPDLTHEFRWGPHEGECRYCGLLTAFRRVDGQTTPQRVFRFYGASWSTTCSPCEAAPGVAWRVLRHSGAGAPSDAAAWVERFAGREDKARERYGKLVKAMRQGGVRLVRPDGSVAIEVHEPRLRTRW